MKSMLKGLIDFREKQARSVLVEDGRVVSVFQGTPDVPDAAVIESNTLFLFPGLVDVHVHLREPGFSRKETIRTGTAAAARGGFAAVCPMPNLDPVPDSVAHLRLEQAAIARDACVRVYPYGAITVGERGEELADLEGLAPEVVAFSDDGKGVQRDAMMRTAMRRAKALGKLIVAHCEDESLLGGGYVHDGAYARAHGHRGNPSASEWKQVERDLALVRETGCAYHVCHVSTKESVELIRRAKADGLDVTCETTPHYLTMDDAMLEEDGRFKMNPPIRSAEDRAALVEGLRDGTVDMIATDHAPHTAEEKGRGLAGSLFGVVGLETAFPVCYTKLVQTGLIGLDRLIEAMHDAPAKRFGIALDPMRDFTVFDLGAQYEIDPAQFRTMGRSTPFAGWTVSGRCLLTVADGKVAWWAEGGEGR